MSHPTNTPRRLRASLLLALAATLLLAPLLSAGPATADTDGGVAWTVRTADNDNGTSRPNFTYEVDPGQVITDTMVVTNTGTITLPLTIYAADAFTTMSGNIDLLAADTPSTGAGAWTIPAMTEVTLAPGQTADIDFTIEVPADAAPGDHGAGLITSFTSVDPSQALEVDRRLATRVNLRVAGELVPASSLTVISTDAVSSLNPFAPAALRVTYRLENTGNTRITGSETIAAHTIAGLLGTSRTEPALPEILPRSTIEVVREVPVTSLGWVGGTLTLATEGVGLGAGILEPVTVEISAVAIPWSLYAVIVLLAGGIVAVLLWVRSAQRKRASGPPAAAD